MAKAEKLGQESGKNAAEWNSQYLWGGRHTGNSKRAAAAFLTAFDNCDGDYLDNIDPPNLSGENADSMTPNRLLELLSCQEFTEEEMEELQDDICQAWETGCNEEFWNTLCESATDVLDGQ